MLDALDYRKVKIDRHTFWVHPVSGRVFPDVRGADGDEGDDPPEPKSFTQADVDKIAARARAEAKRAAASELAEQLGCTIDEAKAKIQAAADADNQTKTDAEKALAAAQAAQAAADQAKAEAARERFDAKVERKLLAAGVGAGLDEAGKDKAIARARRALNLEADADDTAIVDEIDALKADIPSLFTDPTVTPPASPRPAPPAPVKPPAPGGSVTQLDPAREAARKRLGIPATNAS